MKTLTATTKIKSTSRNLRCWIEGKKLTEAGFIWRMPYQRTIKNGVITLTLGGEGKLKVAGRMRGEKEIPIIDISLSPTAMEGFKAGQTVEVTYTAGRIVIK